MHLRRLPISKQRNKTDFKEELESVLSNGPEGNINNSVVEKMSARARDYIASYHHLKTKDANDIPQCSKLSKTTIERMRRMYRCHRSVVDIEHGVISKLVGQLNSKSC